MACSLWDVENDYIVNIRVYIQLSHSCFKSRALNYRFFSLSLFSPHRGIQQTHLVTYITFCRACPSYARQHVAAEISGSGSRCWLILLTDCHTLQPMVSLTACARLTNDSVVTHTGRDLNTERR